MDQSRTPAILPDEGHFAAELLDLGDAFFELDRDWRIVRVNKNQERLSQKPREETLGRVFWDVWPETADPDGPYWREYHRCMKQRTPVQFDAHFAPLDLWTGVTAYPVSTGGIAVFFRDISERKRAERDLRAEHAFTAAVLDTVANVVVVLDREGRIVRVNQACKRLTGYTDAELIGRAVFDVFIRDDELAGVRETFRELGAGQFPNHYENRWRMKDGSERTLEWDNTAILSDDGKVAFVIATGVDVTDRRREREQLQKTGDQFQTLADNIAQLAWMADEAGWIFWYNRRWYEFTGTTLEQMEGWGWQKVHHPDHVERVTEKFRRSVEAGEVWEDTFPLRSKAGDYRWFLSRAIPIRDADGRVVRWFGTNTDITEQKEYEAALAASEARLRATFEDVAVGMVEVDEEDRFVSVNGRFCDMLGYRREELLGRSLHEITAPEDRDQTRELNGRGHAGELEVFDYEKRYLKRDGSPLWVHVTVSVVSRAGQRFRAVGTVEDITTRKGVEDEARSLAQFPTENPNPVLRVSTDGRVLFANPPGQRALESMGFQAGAPVSGPLLDIIRGVPERGTIPFHEVRTVDGRIWSFTLSASAGRGHVNLYGRDVTERSRAEAALRISEEGLRLALGASGSGTFDWDVKTNTNHWSDELLTLYGMSREQFGGRYEDWLECVVPEDREGAATAMRIALETGSFNLEFRIRRRDTEEVRWMDGRGRLTFDAAGKPERMVGLNMDVTPRKKIEEALREADRRKDEFLGMLSHELRNPLAPIRNALYILDRAAPNGEQARRAKEIANRQLAHMTRLVDDLLDVTRIARGKIELRRADIDLAALAYRTAEDHRAIMHDRRLGLEVQLPTEPVIVNADNTRIAQVLGNLLHNAAKFTPAGGRITLAIAAERDRAVIRVRDTGPGIASDVLPTIFEPFTQAKQTLARSEGGLGLGLALVKGIVATHGGEVRAYSPGQGHGTEFVVTLPLARSRDATAARQPKSVPRTDSRRRRVLVIDDNRDAADTIGELVGMLGHDVEVAYDAHDGLAKASEALPDIVFCDIGLPGMDGYEFARQLRARAPERAVRLVALSGYAQPEDVAKALECGFRPMPITDSGACRSPIPVQGDHRFRSKPIAERMTL
jgi:PAS domain S-box-containing protein